MRLKALKTVVLGTPRGIVKKEPGAVFTIPDLEPALRLFEIGKAEPADPCPTCHARAYWISIHDALVCGLCHPPASPASVKKWIGDPEAYNRLKAAKPGLLLSFEDFRRRLQNAGNDR